MTGLQSDSSKSENPLVVLHIEDNPADARLAEIALTRADGHYLSLNAETLDEGVRIVATEDVDVVLLDLGLPGVVGTEGVDAFNSASPQTPIMVLTGDSDPGRAFEALEALADDFLPKSDVDSTSLSRAVRHSIERRRLAIRVREQAAELEGNEARLRTILETITDGILVIDPDGQVLYANPAAKMLYGRTSDDVATWSVSASEMDPGAVIQIERADESLSDIRDTSVRSVEIRSQWVEWEGQRARVVSLRDVTERERMQTQLFSIRLADEVGQLAGGMAHEINNLLAVVLADAGLLQSARPDDEEQQVLTSEIALAAQRGGKLMLELLAYGRRTRLSLRPVDLSRTVSEFEDSLKRLLPASIEMAIAVPHECCAVSADPDSVKRILLNLVSNAHDALSWTGQVTVGVERVSLGHEFCRDHPGAPTGDFVRIFVSDDGSGMDATTVARVCEPFFSTKPDGLGAGLGMPTVFGLVKQHEGYLDIESVPGRGTTVSVYFPAIDLAPVPVETAPDPLLLKGENELVLLVEDKDDLRRAGERALRRLGYRVLVAANGRVALEVFAESKEQIDLVLTDVVMPEMGGGGRARSETRYAAQRAPDPLHERIFRKRSTIGGPPRRRPAHDPKALVDRGTESRGSRGAGYGPWACRVMPLGARSSL